MHVRDLHLYCSEQIIGGLYHTAFQKAASKHYFGSRMNQRLIHKFVVFVGMWHWNNSKAKIGP